MSGFWWFLIGLVLGLSAYLASKIYRYLETKDEEYMKELEKETNYRQAVTWLCEYRDANVKDMLLLRDRLVRLEKSVKKMGVGNGKNVASIGAFTELKNNKKTK
jgi:G:T-mismatch repair DNA endonuclease (very short patch repair protein)